MDPLDSARPWLTSLRPSAPDAVPVICFPHAGGAASYFFPWAEPLAPQMAVLPVQYPGRYERRDEPMPTDLLSLAEAIAHAVAPVVESRPCLFFGHSLGAVVAYEVSRVLTRQGTAPDRLIVSGRRAPTRHVDENVSSFNDKELIAELRRLGGQGTALLDDPEMCAMFLPIIRNDHALVERYRHVPGRQLTCPVTVLSGDQDPRVSEDEARAWGEMTTGATETFIRHGGHFFLDNDREFVLDLIQRRAAELSNVHRLSEQ